MTEREFMEKWYDESIKGWWTNDPSTIYWARSYKMHDALLEKMSRDLLSIPGYDKRKDSSCSLARFTLREDISSGCDRKEQT